MNASEVPADSGAANDPPTLARRLGLGDAVILGLGSMLGARVFASFGTAAAAAGSGLLVALGLAVVGGLRQRDLLRSGAALKNCVIYKQAELRTRQPGAAL